MDMDMDMDILGRREGGCELVRLGWKMQWRRSNTGVLRPNGRMDGWMDAVAQTRGGSAELRGSSNEPSRAEPALT
jgi:hypothetical protein